MCGDLTYSKARRLTGRWNSTLHRDGGQAMVTPRMLKQIPLVVTPHWLCYPLGATYGLDIQSSVGYAHLANESQCSFTGDKYLCSLML